MTAARPAPSAVPASSVAPAAPVGVAVTGLGCLCAAGGDLDEVLARLDAAPLPPALPEGFAYEPRHPVFSVPLPTPGQSAQARTLVLAREAARQALEQSGLGASLPQAVIVGTSVGASPDLLPLYRDWKEGLRPDPAVLDGYLHSFTAEALAKELGIAGPAWTVTNACTSGADAIGLAWELIRGGLADCVLAGGADALSEMTYWGFCSLQLCSEGPCRPFDKNRAGLNLGEGAAFMVLENAERARKRGATLFGYILGYGSAADAHHPTAPHPKAGGLNRAVAAALRPCGPGSSNAPNSPCAAGAAFAAAHAPAAPAFISAHATATPANDAVEGAFAASLPGKPKVYGLKGAIGHCLGAAGAIEAVLALAHLRRGRLCPTHGFQTPDPALGLVPAVDDLVVAGDTALSFSLGFGGNNAALLLGLSPAAGKDDTGGFARTDAPKQRRRPSVLSNLYACGYAGPAGLGAEGLHRQSPDKRTAPDILKSLLAAGEARRLDHFSRLALCADRDAGRAQPGETGPEQAQNADPTQPGKAEQYLPEETGIILISRFGPLSPTVDFWESLLAFGPEGASALAFAASVQNIPTAQISIKNGWTGPCLTVCGPGPTLKQALALAKNRIALGLVRQIRLIVADEYAPFLGENIVLRGSGLPPLREGATAFLLRAGEKAGPGRADAAGRSTASRVPFPTALASAICLAGRLLHKRRKA